MNFGQAPYTILIRINSNTFAPPDGIPSGGAVTDLGQDQITNGVDPSFATMATAAPAGRPTRDPPG
jgi:hypothetical protein